MLTEPLQEDIFRENEFVETRFRSRLLPVWVKVLTWFTAFVAFVFAAVCIYVPFAPDRSDPAMPAPVLFHSIGAVLIAGLAARIFLLQEKKWAIIGAVFATLTNLLVLSAMLSASDAAAEGKIMLVILWSLTAIELVFLVRLIFMFKKWRAYHPSPR
ncbi:hypothetical protein ACFOTA_06375 [Chitinophaga sp. GCM10012297]|uniref:Uncharacterized protein n=1 Tax=Chitinophaga chungangae TaxID=2821488 RepID=A0ABS3YBG9_9BACT|nr:hypothetical protein [Chitinophaga chungangae]MBO9151825.1 hypothetical protein [Chitinophaga chungangae]